ncbi:MAG: PfkB family carbohydrate kinase [bacterium]|nr:PfkB family carbohydrate kinase [bacterium]
MGRKGLSEKIVEMDILAKESARLREEGKKIVYCHGCFDLMHIGHIKYLQAAKKKGDILMVTITPDRYVSRGPGRPVFTEIHRLESIAALDCVNYVALNQWTTAVETIHLLKPNIYVKGSDFGSVESDPTGRLTKEEEAIKSVGGELVFTADEVFSSSKLLKDYFGVLPKELDEFLVNFTQRFNITEVIGSLTKIQDIRILIIGEPIIDEYHFCSLLQRASKAPTIATRWISSEEYAGGSLAVANHLAGFIKDVGLIGLLGRENSREEFIRQNLKPNVKFFPCFREDGATVIKVRFLEKVFSQKIFEVQYFNDYPINGEVEKGIINLLKELMSSYDMVISADFGHGFITPKIVNMLCQEAPYLVVMAQSNSSNLGFNPITKYSRADYIVIDHPEIRLACHDQHGDLEPLIKKISKELKCSRINVTLGHEGTLYCCHGTFYRVPVASWKVVDTIGAGDAVLAITSPLTYLNLDPELVAFIGNCAGALAVQYLGNKESIDPAHLKKLIETLMK